MRIALVVLDTLRKDSFNNHFEWLPGRRFENAWSTSHWTVPAHASLVTGYYPSEIGVYAKNLFLDCVETTLQERLENLGFRTRAYSANPLVSPEFGWGSGFHEFRRSTRLKGLDPLVFDWKSFADSYDWQTYLSGIYSCIADDYRTLDSLYYGLELKFPKMLRTDSGAKKAHEFIRNADFEDREFLFINLMEAHSSFSPPDHPLFLDPEGTVDQERARHDYDENVSYLSDQYRKIFDTLYESFDYVITLADHGEMLGENGVYGHTYGLYPELTKIPLCISSKERELSGTVEDVVNILDVHRTILDLAEIDAPSRGNNLLDEPKSRTALTEYHGITMSRKIESLRSVGVDAETIDMYEEDLRGVAISPDYYGYQTHNSGFRSSGSSEPNDPEGTLADIIASLSKCSTDEADEVVSDAAKQRLGDLGYL